ncbi:MAG TPA: helix-turn-helix transcriptional regulator [Pirellulaceae bacterium]|nr:helix-turn-helix transcriptional regulator [Pirellulaceae bacterium]
MIPFSQLGVADVPLVGRGQERVAGGDGAASDPRRGENFRRLRDHGLLRPHWRFAEELSFAAEIDRTYVSQLERDLKSPTVDVLFRICDALKISASEFIARLE